MNKQISASEASILKEKGEVVLLDVREHSELTICKIEGALHIPLGEVIDCFSTLPKDKTIIVFCHHGMRSLNAQKYLVSKGFDNVINMEGGIHAWADEVDTKLAHY